MKLLHGHFGLSSSTAKGEVLYIDLLFTWNFVLHCYHDVVHEKNKPKFTEVTLLSASFFE